MKLWVFAEESDGAPSTGSLELISKACTHGEVNVFYVGPGSDDAFATLGDHGATHVHHLDVGDTLASAPAAATNWAPEEATAPTAHDPNDGKDHSGHNH